MSESPEFRWEVYSRSSRLSIKCRRTRKWHVRFSFVKPFGIAARDVDFGHRAITRILEGAHRCSGKYGTFFRFHPLKEGIAGSRRVSKGSHWQTEHCPPRDAVRATIRTLPRKTIKNNDSRQIHPANLIRDAFRALPKTKGIIYLTEAGLGQ